MLTYLPPSSADNIRGIIHYIKKTDADANRIEATITPNTPPALPDLNGVLYRGAAPEVAFGGDGNPVELGPEDAEPEYEGLAL